METNSSGKVTCSDPFCRCHDSQGLGHCQDCTVLPTIVVTLGIARPDNTWTEKKVEFEIDPEWENNPNGDLLRDLAFNHWCHDFANNGPTAEYAKTQYEKAEAVSKVNIHISGYFVLNWEWKDEAGEERTDRPCDENCARRLAGNDSVECNCSRSS